MNNGRRRLAALGLCAALITMLSAGCSAGPVLKIEDEEISRKEMEFYLKNAVSTYLSGSEEAAADPQGFLAADSGDGRKNSEVITDNAVEEILKTRAIDKKFKELGLSFTPDEKAEMESMKQQIVTLVGGDIEYKRFLSNIGITAAMYDAILERDYKAQKITDTVFAQNSKYEVLPRQVEEYYDENYLRVRHILIAVVDETGSALSAEEKAEKEELARNVRDRAASGEDFIALTEEFDESVYDSEEEREKYKDGFVFTKGEMQDEIYEAAKDLPVGEVAPVVETSLGYHILKAYDIRETASLLESQRQNIVNYIEGQIFTSLMSNWTAALRVEKNDAALYKMDLTEYI